MAGQGPRAKAAAAVPLKPTNPFICKPTTPVSSSSLAHVDHAHLAGIDTLLGSLDINKGELPCASITDDSALVSMALNELSTLFDSSTTSHLIKSQDLFWMYNITAAHDVKTANLGVLTTAASGDCVANFWYNNVVTCVKLHDCLHAPNAALNLLLVGRFVSIGMTCTFQDRHVLLSVPAKTFRTGPMVNHVFVLDMEYLKP